MNVAVKKLSGYLDDRAAEILLRSGVYKDGDKLFYDEHYLIKNKEFCFYTDLYRILNSSAGDSLGDIIMEQFSSLSQILLSLPFNGRECLDIVLYFVRKNIELGKVLNSNIRVAMLYQNKLLAQGFSEEEIQKVQNFDYVKRLLIKDTSLLSKEERKKRAILKSAICILNNNFIDGHKEIQEHLLKKEKTYNEADIEKAHSAFLKLGIDEALCIKMQRILQRNLEKRVMREIHGQEEAEEKHEISKQQERQEEIGKKQETEKNKEILIEEILEKERMTPKEYKKIRKEIANYFDIFTGMPVEQLTQEEILYCARLLQKIEVEDAIVQALFDRANYLDLLFKKSQEKPIATYLEMTEELKFYEEKLDIQDTNKELEDYFSDIFLSSQEDYVVWKEIMKDELGRVIKNILPNARYQYERKLAATSKKTNVKVKSRNTKK